MSKAKGNSRTNEGSVSIIVPIYNEEATVRRLLAQLERVRNNCEIIFVDGGSLDKTLALIPSSWTILNGKCGRGNQLNEGYKASTGDILLFLHCDSVLPPNFLHQIHAVMANNDMGYFGIKFDSPDLLMKICERMSNLRAQSRHVVFGDQGIFIKREVFEQLGGFPNIALMEDYQFSLNARKAKVSMGQTKDPLITSARRFGKGAFHQLKVMYSMHKFRWLYRRGTSVNTIRQMFEAM